MPQIKFTDTAIRTLAVEKTTWFSDKSCKGLRLCVTPTGTKTWYVTRWDSNAQKTRSVKLAQWAAKGAHTAWAKRQVGKASLDIQEGNARVATFLWSIPSDQSAFLSSCAYAHPAAYRCVSPRRNPSSDGFSVHLCESTLQSRS